jgi:hypothetical protein
MACYLGQQEIFEEASHSLKLLVGVDISAKQIERMCHFYGGELEDELESKIKSGETRIPPGENTSDLHYAMLDGAQFMTRDDGWKEIKLGRIFRGDANLPLSEKRRWIRQSQYIAHLGEYRPFLEKFEMELHGLENFVIVADGAKWIWEWAEANYPEKVQILDFYHAMEHLWEFARLYIKGQSERAEWVAIQKTLLLESDSGVEDVIRSIKAFPKSKSMKKGKVHSNLLGYVSRNRKRMRYKQFQENGLMIGSGPIESAHRSVLQKRLKLTGQRWSRRGLQALANLRTLNKNGEWDRIIDFIQPRAAA